MSIVTRYLAVLFIGLMLIQGYAAYHTMAATRYDIAQLNSRAANSFDANNHLTLLYDSMAPAAGKGK